MFIDYLLAISQVHLRLYHLLQIQAAKLLYHHYYCTILFFPKLFQCDFLSPYLLKILSSAKLYALDHHARASWLMSVGQMLGRHHHGGWIFIWQKFELKKSKREFKAVRDFRGRLQHEEELKLARVGAKKGRLCLARVVAGEGKRWQDETDILDALSTLFI